MPIETPGCCDTQYELLRKILLSLPFITESGTNICGFTPASVIFVGPTGCLTEDPTDFSYDPVTNTLTVSAARFFTPSTESLFIGENAGNFTVTGIDNTGVGFNALMSLTTGDSNTTIGNNSLSLNTTGFSNTAIGGGALRNNTIGHDNDALGKSTLSFNTTGNSNTAIGAGAILDNTIGNENTSVGRRSLLNNLSGNANVALGFESGRTATPANTNVTGSNNTFIGYQSGPGTAVQRTNATAVGYQALVSQDNSLTLGGIGANAVSVGIGTTTPNSRLQVSGAISTPIATKAVAYPVVETDGVILVNAVAAPVTITLPTPVGIDGRRYTVKKIDASANAVTIATAAGTIDGAATKVTIIQYVSYDFVSNGANWFIV